MKPATHSCIPAPRIFFLSLFSLLIFSLSARPVSAATIHVDSSCTLAQAIESANSNATPTGSNCEAGSSAVTDEINLSGNVTLASATDPNTANAIQITSSLTINGNHRTITGSNVDTLFELTGDISVTINDVTMKNNSQADSGGVIQAYSGANLTVNNGTFKDNSAEYVGGAISVSNSGGNLTITKSSFSNNQVTNTTDSSVAGGAIYFVPSSKTLTISDSSFSSNSSTFVGGAMRCAGTCDITNSIFDSNSAGTLGGAIAFSDSPSKTIRNSVLSKNTATNSGGAFSLSAVARVTVENSTVYENSSSDKGGAVHGNITGITATFRHVTFVNNSATNEGKTIYVHAASTLNLYNSIIKEKASPTGADCVGLDANIGNISDDSSCSSSSSLNKNPLLGGRAGSPAYYTLQAGSPAIDAANATQCGNLADVGGIDVDQRGRRRPYPVGGGCDIGAFEWYPPPPRPPDSGDDDDDDDGEPAPTPMPGPRCGFCADLLAKGYRLRARYGLESGVQFRRVDRDGIGVQSALDAGFRDAVDVYGYAEQGVEVCFPAAGSLILLDATTSPRAPASVPGYTREGRTCAAIDRPGTLVLVDNPPAGLPILTTSVTFAAPAPVAEAVGSGYQQLHSCMVTTPGLIRFRDAPGGAPLLYTDPWGRQENGWLPGYVTLTALERTPDWFKVDYYGTRGWVSAHHVTTHGVCG
ncbi:MAG: right-handed parallel beta-helix repeat-containing protein [Chloroflexi bacterium]|nr:right-handed parallel beta-helix repeat-containing protein [Chloroflexota bacterium]